MQRKITLLSSLVLAALSLLLAPSTAVTQEGSNVQWRKDYASARAEAKEKGLPLVLDFGTDNCYWCRELEAKTFRDQSVIRTMNERFIPLKINAELEDKLASALRISSYPTIVMADSDGKILGTIIGFKEAPKFHEDLQRALASVANPDWMQRDYKVAGDAYNSSDYAKAVTLLKLILEDGKTRPVQMKARQLLTDIEQQAAARLVQAQKLQDNGQTSASMSALGDLVRIYSGTQSASEASGYLNTLIKGDQTIRDKTRQQRAKELLAQAREDYRTRQYVCCLDRCEILSGSFGDLAEGIEGMQLANEIKSNPEWLQNACDSLSERLSTMYLALSDTWMKKGQPQQAAHALQKVIHQFPGSRYAEVAQIRLSQIQGSPTRQVEFQKQ